jgi:hypothetical protein
MLQEGFEAPAIDELTVNGDGEIPHQQLHTSQQQDQYDDEPVLLSSRESRHEHEGQLADEEETF